MPSYFNKKQCGSVVTYYKLIGGYLNSTSYIVGLLVFEITPFIIPNLVKLVSRVIEKRFILCNFLLSIFKPENLWYHFVRIFSKHPVYTGYNG